MKKYVLLGGAGYVAEKHYRAIKETGGELIAILDPHDNVGILDSYFPNCLYFHEFERFDRYCSGQDIDYTVVCSPNYLHDSHCRFGLRIGSDVICEKPLVLHKRNLNGLIFEEAIRDQRIWNILQLRLGKFIQNIQQEIRITGSNSVFLEYSVARGSWYDYSWKGDIEKSGGVLFNIGIHLFDLLLHLFGKQYEIKRWRGDHRYQDGLLRIGSFDVGISLDITMDSTPVRLLSIGNEDFDLSKDFTDLHIESYKQILSGKGFGIEDVRPAITLCEKLRNWK
jgi:UDP-N-acetyl-2-amino-2-deoxyglucuronate dehydrogenase